ncbi:MAG: imidazole glycerol phosphate synthase subunit HisH [Spirochaetes bacterium]|nr:imidazole glycerol phosphate synthase subunit HisH [Spirochaetota bacterium]
MIVVVDYGMGNIRSVTKAFELYTDKVVVSADPSSLESAKGVILPGDGAFAMAMENLEKAGWINPLKQYIAEGGCFMGICLGYQLLFSSSEEFGFSKGLDIIPGRVVRFNGDDQKVPHMGWNCVSLTRESVYLRGVPDGSYFYFIHSYYPVLDDQSWEIASAEYGVRFPCMVGRGKVFASQFHPEKSHNNGLKIVQNFVNEVYYR